MKAHNDHIIAGVHANVRRLLLERGVKGWSMDELAEMSGLAKKTLYKIAGSREKVIHTVVVRDVRQRIAATVDLLDADEEFEQKLRRMEVVIPDSVSQYDLKGVVAQVKRQHPAIWDEIHALQLKLAEPLHEFFAKGIREGKLRRELTPQDIADLIYGIVIICNENHSGPELREKIALGISVVLQGIRVQGDSRPGQELDR